MKKLQVDNALKLDTTELRRMGFFQTPEGRGLILRWRRGEQVVSRMCCGFRTLSANAALLHLSYVISESSRENQALDYEILLLKSKCYFGGERYWFMCPLTIEGRPCRRRCRILYLPNGARYFGCRVCYDLTYESRQRHRERFYEGVAKPWDRKERAKEKLKRARTSKTRRKWANQLLLAEKTIGGYLNKI